MIQAPTKIADKSAAIPAQGSSLKVWLDGQLVDKSEAKISVYDTGVFEGIRIYSGQIFEADAHLRRLFDSARAIRLAIPMTPAQLKSAIEQTFKANNFVDAYVRVVVTRGSGYLGLSPNKCPKASVFVIADTI